MKPFVEDRGDEETRTACELAVDYAHEVKRLIDLGSVEDASRLMNYTLAYVEITSSLLPRAYEAAHKAHRRCEELEERLRIVGRKAFWEAKR